VPDGFPPGVLLRVRGRCAPFPDLSRFLCKLICGWSFQVGAESVWVGQGECSEGRFPALDGGAFDEFGWGSALVGVREARGVSSRGKAASNTRAATRWWSSIVAGAAERPSAGAAGAAVLDGYATHRV
jgi:hypothetical protein